MRVGEPQIFGKLQITLASEEPTKDFAIRKFEVKEDKVSIDPEGFTICLYTSMAVAMGEGGGGGEEASLFPPLPKQLQIK